MEESQQMKVVRHILMNTPAGEHKLVLADLQNLLGSEVIQSEPVLQILLEAISAHGATFHQDSKKWVISPYCKLNQAVYFDAKYEMQFEVNPFEMSLSNFSPHAYGNSTSKLIQLKLDDYLMNHFTENQAGRVYVDGDSYIIFIAVTSTNFKNCWTGEFKAQWTLKGKSLKGEMNIKAHSFEEGNFCYCKEAKVDVPVKAEEEKAIVEEVFEVIRESDLSFQKSFVDLSLNLPHELFKPLRRTMAVNRSKFADMNKHRMLKFDLA